MGRDFRVSQCMIVKNEEENIERALSWGRNMMWEQIVVDTGSTDRTVELAEKLGAKVYHFSWIDDFAAAKNYACGQATGDWIIFLDADEYMTPEDVEKTQSLLTEIENEGAGYLAILTNLFNLDEAGKITEGGNQMRIFRNRRGICYMGAIHERLMKGEKELDTSELLDASEELSIYHTGYTKHAFETTRKVELYKRIILKELEEDPGNSEMMGNLADVYKSEGRHDLAMEWYEKSIHTLFAEGAEPQLQDQRMSWTFFSLLQISCVTGAPESRIMELYGQATWYLPRECDFDYMMGCYFLEKKDWEGAAYHLERALTLFEKWGNLYFGRILTADLMKAREYLAIAGYNAGQKEKCVNACVSYLRENRFSMGVLKVLLMVFGAEAGNGETGDILDFLGKLYDFAALKDRLFVLRSAKEVGYLGLVEAVRGLFSAEELEALGGYV